MLFGSGDGDSELNVSSSNEAKKSDWQYSCLLARLPLKKTIEKINTTMFQNDGDCIAISHTAVFFFWFEVHCKREVIIILLKLLSGLLIK